MKKYIFILLILTGCGQVCLTQPPPQYLNIDANCTAILPDYRTKVTTSDNCGAVTLIQTPAAGAIISENKQVIIKATDKSGNSSQITFDVILIDTTPPVITWNGAIAESQSAHDTVMKLYDVADDALLAYQKTWNNQFPWDSLGIPKNDTILIRYKLVIQ